MIITLLHAVSTRILSSSKDSQYIWFSAVSDLLSSHQEIIRAYILLIRPQVALIVQKLVDNRRIAGIKKWWKMSDEDAEYFAGQIITCVEDFSFILADSN